MLKNILMGFSLGTYSSKPQTGHLKPKPFAFDQLASISGENSANLAPP